jgi:uncharacterized membrane protein YeaQ/YmgE (transglycosylase-associated protein family)
MAKLLQYALGLLLWVLTSIPAMAIIVATIGACMLVQCGHALPTD